MAFFRKPMKNKLNPAITSLFFLFLSSSAFALPCAPGIRNGFYNDLKQNISIIGKFDNRESSADFGSHTGQTASEIRARFIATGRIHCADGFATANLVLKDDVLTTNAHVFYADAKSENCVPRTWSKNLGKCYFAPLLNDEDEGPKYEIDPKTLQVGTKCPNNMERSKDWAVVKLKKRVLPVMIENKKIEIKPYALFRGKINEFTNRSALQVAAAGKKNMNGKHLANICDGLIRGFDLEGGVNAIVSDCSSKPGNSGSGYIVSEKTKSPANGKINL
jgi:hypothetical protein